MKMDFEEYLKVVAPGLNFPEPKEYELNLIQIRNALSATQFFKGLHGQLHSMANEYAPGHPHLLFGHRILEPDVLVKGYNSAINKTFRQNVVFNGRYPKEPSDGWIDGKSFYRRINDIARCRIVCRYMDGPRFVCDNLANYCKSLGLEHEFYAVNTDRGYYAWHFYCRHQMDLFSGGGVISEGILFELQITTQLVEVLDALTHTLYEADRVSPKGRPNDDWKWEPDTQRFRSAYLGHTLHLLEGVILTLKNQVMAPETQVQNAAQAEPVEEKKV